MNDVKGRGKRQDPDLSVGGSTAQRSSSKVHTETQLELDMR